MSSRILLALRTAISVTDSIDNWIRSETSTIEADEDVVAAVTIGKGNIIEGLKAKEWLIWKRLIPS